MPSCFSLLPHRSVISVAGADRVEFLQGLISNDTTKVAPDHAIWAALLTPQGRFLNDMFVADAGGDTFFLETERERAPALARKLKMYTLRSKVTVEDLGDTLEVAAAFGDDASKALGDRGRRYRSSIPVSQMLGVRVIAPAGQTATLLSARGFDRGAARRLRRAAPAARRARRQPRPARSRRRCCSRTASTS